MVSVSRLGLVVRRSVGKQKDPGSVGRLGLVVRRSVGKCEPAWPSGKALGW